MNLNWRIIAAVVVAFIVGAAAGGLAEHIHVENDKTDTSAGATTTTVPTVDWFGTQKSAACPTLTKWYSAIGRSAYLSASKGAWTTTRADLLEQDSTISAAYRALLSNVNDVGRNEILFLVAYGVRSRAALQNATSAAAYAASQRASSSTQLSRNVSVLVQAAKTCPKS